MAQRAELLTPADLRTELNSRGLTPTNFREDDVAQLQPLLDAEYAAKKREEKVEAERVRLEAREAEEARLAEEAKRESLRKEREADEADPQTAAWLEQVRGAIAATGAEACARRP